MLKKYQNMQILVFILMLIVPAVVHSAENVPVGLQHLLNAYPEYLQSASLNVLNWKDGTAMVYDDGIQKNDFDTRFNMPDLEDQMSLSYPAGMKYSVPLKDDDPGRIRYEPFFKKMYGSTPKEVRSKLAVIRWMPKTVNKKIRISSVNNVHKHLQAVSDELDRLPKDLKKYVSKIAGTFNWRKIAGTKSLSLHSFGIAIDINRKYSHYWRWGNLSDPKYKNSIPMEIVDIFEKHGFIWGGKWYHYDTMHFEYRPELLIK